MLVVRKINATDRISVEEFQVKELQVKDHLDGYHEVSRHWRKRISFESCAVAFRMTDGAKQDCGASILATRLVDDVGAFDNPRTVPPVRRASRTAVPARANRMIGSERPIEF